MNGDIAANGGEGYQYSQYLGRNRMCGSPRSGLSFFPSYIAGRVDIGFLLTERLLYAGFLAFFIIPIISSFIAAMAGMLRPAKLEYLISPPGADREFFTGGSPDSAA